MKGIYKLLFLVLLGTGIALAQTSPTSSSDQSQQPSSQSQPPSSQSQQTPDQSQQPPAASSPQSQYPSSSGQSSSGQAGATTSSSDVKTAIQTAFQQDPSLMNSGIKVSVSDSKITLSGSASSTDKEKAHRIAEANAGGRTVVDKVTTNDSTGAAPKQ
jgi:osmotically-inducible protein OsmY